MVIINQLLLPILFKYLNNNYILFFFIKFLNSSSGACQLVGCSKTYLTRIMFSKFQILNVIFVKLDIYNIYIYSINYYGR